jgi:hypothetical protein
MMQQGPGGAGPFCAPVAKRSRMHEPQWQTQATANAADNASGIGREFPPAPTYTDKSPSTLPVGLPEGLLSARGRRGAAVLSQLPTADGLIPHAPSLWMPADCYGTEPPVRSLGIAKGLAILTGLTHQVGDHLWSRPPFSGPRALQGWPRCMRVMPRRRRRSLGGLPLTRPRSMTCHRLRSKLSLRTPRRWPVFTMIPLGLVIAASGSDMQSARMLRTCTSTDTCDL